MKSNKKRILLSAVSVLVVLCLLAGGTMAWFTDTEKVNGNFTAGVLDITVNPGEDGFTTTEPMEFKNLRPMKLENFDKELDVTGTKNQVSENGQEDSWYPADNFPIYFKPVTIYNDGTLPVYIHLGAVTQTTPLNPDDKEPVLYGDDKYTIDQDKYDDVACENTLEKVIKLLVYEKKADDTWERLEGVNLNKTTAGVENECYDPTVVIPAGEGGKMEYVVAGYLPETTGNEYQGKHYHGKLEVTARQADQGPYNHNEGKPGMFTVNVPVQIEDQTVAGAETELYKGDVPMTFKVGTTAATAGAVETALNGFLASDDKYDGYTLNGSIPSHFEIEYNTQTGEYEANMGGSQYLLVGVKKTVV